jgi:hypothetical protein
LALDEKAYPTGSAHALQATTTQDENLT